MRSIETEGKDKQAAIEAALAELELGRKQVRVEVLDEGSKGFLGMGSKAVRVRVSPLDDGDDGASVLAQLLTLMGFDFQLESGRRDDEEFVDVQVEADEGLLIGRRGQTVDSLRHLTQRVLSARRGENSPVNVDVGGYRLRREEQLKDKAFEAASKALDRKRQVALEPMTAQDRRIVHLSLSDAKGVETFTVGDGARRRVVVAPEGSGRRRQARDDAAPRRERARDDATPRRKGPRSEKPRRERDEQGNRERSRGRRGGSRRPRPQTAYGDIPDPGFTVSPVTPEAERQAQEARERLSRESAEAAREEAAVEETVIPETEDRNSENQAPEDSQPQESAREEAPAEPLEVSEGDKPFSADLAQRVLGIGDSESAPKGKKNKRYRS